MSKAIIGILFLQFLCGGLIGSENQEPIKRYFLTTHIDVMSSHVWRGGKSGMAPSVEPYIEFKSGKFTFGSWAAATFDNEYREIDLYGLFTINDFSIGIYDYYCPPAKPATSNFTDFKGNDTHHLFSIDLVYYGTTQFPVKLTASTMFLGMDINHATGNYYYSTYLEAVYSKNWNNNSVSAILGCTTHKGIYADGFAFMNSELMYKKSFNLYNFTLPVFVKVVYNPNKNQAWYIGGFAIERVFGF